MARLTQDFDIDCLLAESTKQEQSLQYEKGVW